MSLLLPSSSLNFSLSLSTFSNLSFSQSPLSVKILGSSSMASETPFSRYIIAMATSQDPNSESENRAQDRIVMIDPVTRNMIMIDAATLTALFHEFSGKEGQMPASKKSIDDMPTVKVTEVGRECAICLEEQEVGGEVKEMPCKHRFHSGCIDKWLGIHGSCPVCRYKMPVDEEDKKSSDGEVGDSDSDSDGDFDVDSDGGVEDGARMVMVGVWIGSDRRDSDSGRAGESISETRVDGNGEVDGGSAEDMDWID